MNKIVVISGASQGLGLKLAEQFFKDGDTVIGLSRSIPSDAAWRHIQCDVASQDSVTAAIKQIEAEFSRVDILINNAGVGVSGATELIPPDKVSQVMDIDYMGALWLTRAVLPLMGVSGRVIFVSSACALFALPYRSVYCSAKAAMNMLSFGMRMELKDTGIKVVCVCPGDVKTTFTSNRLKYFDTNIRYGDKVKAAYDKVDSKHDKRMNPDKVTKKLYKIIISKNKALYILGTKYKILHFFQRILPTNLFIKLTGKFFG